MAARNTNRKASVKPSKASRPVLAVRLMQGPIDGKIASGGNSLFSALDAQSATRWQMTEIKDRNIDFQWRYTAVHPATKHEYFITRDGWNPNEALKRASFESTPFCTVDGGNQTPV